MVEDAEFLSTAAEVWNKGKGTRDRMDILWRKLQRLKLRIAMLG